ncbi:MAG: hypothetical protein MK041_09990, partial [Aquabacterium sp.]|nr:hypothetical protein [Aquabacterium sp.]
MSGAPHPELAGHDGGWMWLAAAAAAAALLIAGLWLARLMAATQADALPTTDWLSPAAVLALAACAVGFARRGQREQ